MTNQYYETISQLQQQNTNREYVTGWVTGFLGNPKLEEQRITDAWEAGYEDGQAKNTENASKWQGGQ